MTYRELAKQIEKMTEEQKSMLATIVLFPFEEDEEFGTIINVVFFKEGISNQHYPYLEID